MIYFGGHFIITGTVLPHNAHAEENMVAKAEVHGKPAEGTVVAEAAPLGSARPVELWLVVGPASAFVGS